MVILSEFSGELFFVFDIFRYKSCHWFRFGRRCIMHSELTSRLLPAGCLPRIRLVLCRVVTGKRKHGMFWRFLGEFLGSVFYIFFMIFRHFWKNIFCQHFHFYDQFVHFMVILAIFLYFSRFSCCGSIWKF